MEQRDRLSELNSEFAALEDLKKQQKVPKKLRV